MVEIDGSRGEGGGQILRTALGLSLFTGIPFTLRNIRAKRSRRGLMRQHLTCVEAAARIGRAEVSGDRLGSLDLAFAPGAVAPGDYAFDVGTAGSTPLVLQTVLPALLGASAPTRIALQGGTHNPMAPNLDFLERTFLPCIRRMGAGVAMTRERRGFYPAGGGRWTVEVTPWPRPLPLELPERGAAAPVRGRILWARIPREVARRQRARLAERLGLGEDAVAVEEDRTSIGPGNAVLVELASEHVTEIVSGYGERGVAAEAVADAVAREAEAYLRTGAPVGAHLADQLMVPLAVGAGGSYVTGPLSSHSRTNLETVAAFLDTRLDVRGIDAGRSRVTIGGT